MSNIEFKRIENWLVNDELNNILDVVLLSEKLFVTPTAIIEAAKVVGHSKNALIEHFHVLKKNHESRTTMHPRARAWKSRPWSPDTSSPRCLAE